jgi:23S rRNA (cytidine1920-2'-O)/16S rRNA (cytidine1409-2'-O)-methyltransferase
VRRRLDVELVRRGLATSRTEAVEAIRDGRVRLAGNPAEKAATMVGPHEAVEVDDPGTPSFVSRGGAKLKAALDRFDVDPSDRRCLDAGASTGGFTDCLLHQGAAAVVAVDVGYGQLAWPLRNDPRVTVLERTNVRVLEPDALPYRPDLVVADLSFISLRTVLPSLAALASRPADVVLLVKPQFEAGRADVGKGGVVRDPGVWRRVLGEVVDALRAVGAEPCGVMASPILGPAGNAEFLLYATLGEQREAAPDLDIEVAIREATQLREAS